MEVGGMTFPESHSFYTAMQQIAEENDRNYSELSGLATGCECPRLYYSVKIYLSILS